VSSFFSDCVLCTIDAHSLGVKRVHEMIDERMKDVHEMIDKKMKAESIYRNSVENIKFLDIQKSKCFCDAKVGNILQHA